MADIEYWIQLENHPWDACPNGIDRITGEMFTSVGKWNGRDMFKPLGSTTDKPLGEDALILRRYKPPQQADESDAWTIPNDRKVNAWDLNEPDPTDTGTKGTIPGPVLECNIGDSVIVHFRNMDMRGGLKTDQICFPFPSGEICLPFVKFVPLPVEKRTHSLHPHGFVFAPTSDGAYPLSPPDRAQPVAGPPGPDETAAWATVPGFSGNLKYGDRVPPSGSFIYRWDTGALDEKGALIGWPTTAGVWLYHDHSICDMENVELGAIGIIVIHNPADTEQEVDIRDLGDPSKLDPAFLPGGSPNGDPRVTFCFPFPPLPPGFPFREIRALPHDLEGLGSISGTTDGHQMAAMANDAKPKNSEPEGRPPILERTIKRGDVLFEFDEKLEVIRSICFRHYRTPPTKALYLQLFHTLTGAPGMSINGRTFLGNTPTMVAGPSTRMRFGVVGMGSDFHTFHIHGHRWIIPGPDGNTPNQIQNSPMVTAVSQFEDTKIFGPANSFAFTIDEGNGFMRASPAVGEWHMHCHVLRHMMTGMMGSLLVVNGGNLALTLPVGVPCEMPKMDGGGTPPNGGPAMTATVRGGTVNCTWTDVASGTPETTIKVGGNVRWEQVPGCGNHTVESVGTPSFADVNTLPDSRTFNTAGDYGYRCGIHGGDPVAKTDMWGIVHVVP
jgi:FtsP/CotA-like multicopper oxidase with cupredoxin domain/plastocyanin